MGRKKKDKYKKRLHSKHVGNTSNKSKSIPPPMKRDVLSDLLIGMYGITGVFKGIESIKEPKTHFKTVYTNNAKSLFPPHNFARENF